LYKGSDVSRYEEKLEEAYQSTTYAATHRSVSLAVCDWCNTYWNVTPQDILVGARYNPARTVCPTCGKSVRVYPRNWRNRIAAYFNTTDSLVALMSLIFLVAIYVGLLYSAYQYGIITVLLYLAFLCLSAMAFIRIAYDNGELPKTEDDKIDYDLIKDVINKEVE